MSTTLLPVGSVVLLNDSNKRVMIVGRLQRQENGTLWDYSACFYPEGIIDPTKLFLFNHDQIEAVFFIGFQDKEGLDFQRIINEQRKALVNNMGQE